MLKWRLALHISILRLSKISVCFHHRSCTNTDMDVCTQRILHMPSKLYMYVYQSQAIHVHVMMLNFSLVFARFMTWHYSCTIVHHYNANEYCLQSLLGWMPRRTLAGHLPQQHPSTCQTQWQKVKVNQRTEISTTQKIYQIKHTCPLLWTWFFPKKT